MQNALLKDEESVLEYSGMRLRDLPDRMFTKDFLKRLDRKVTIQISPHHPGEPYQEVGFGL